MTFVIVGGGPTGVELAGTLAEVSRQTLARDFRHINTASARVILVEASPRVLGAYTEDLSEAARSSSRSWAWRSGPESRSPGSTPKGSGSAGADPCAHGHLGRGRRRLAAGPDARRAARPGRPRLGRARADDPRAWRRLRHRRPGPRRAGRRARAGRRPRRDAAGLARRRKHRAHAPRPASPAVSLRRQGDAGHDRPRCRRRQGRARSRPQGISPGCSGCSSTSSS